jgi:uncharacterized coiled-coil DUF342 family protein
MSEQSDTPRVYAVLQSFGFIAHTDRAAAMWLDTVINIARDLERELATATRERDEARAIANDRDAMVDHRDRALTAIYQRVDVITQERDEARAEVERLRKTLDEIATYWNGSHRPAETLDAAEWTQGVAEEALAATEAKP